MFSRVKINLKYSYLNRVGNNFKTGNSILGLDYGLRRGVGWGRRRRSHFNTGPENVILLVSILNEGSKLKNNR